MRLFPACRRFLFLLILPVLSLSAGSITLAATAQEPVSTPYALHFKPDDHLLGDVHPFFPDTKAGGECFLFYLKPGGYHSALVRSTDLLHWTEAPIGHDPARAGDWLSPYFVLGVLHDPLAPAAAPPLYRSFYGHKDGRVASSISTDLLHWSCAPQDVSIPPADYYQRRRDPYVFWMPATRQFGCVMTTWMKNRPKETGGAISFATSPDLRTWQDHGPILDPGTIGEPECPQMFQVPGSPRWYLLASIYDRAVGQPVYWTADSPMGPWPKTPTGRLDGPDLCAAQMAFDGATPLLFGWVPLRPSRPGKQIWGGHLALPREIHALPGHTLATRLPARLSQALDRLSWQSRPDQTVGNSGRAVIAHQPGFALQFAAQMPKAVHQIELSFAAIANKEGSGFLPPDVTQLWDRDRAPLGSVLIQRDHLRILDLIGECWAELPLATPLPIDEPIKACLLVDNDLVELFVNDRYSLAARLPGLLSTDTVAFLPAKSGYNITGIRVAPLQAAAGR